MIGKTYLLLLLTTLIHVKGSEFCLEHCKINNLIFNPYETMFAIPPEIFLFKIKDIRKDTIVPAQHKTPDIKTLTIFKKIRSNNNRNNLLGTPETAHITTDFEKNN